MTWKSGPDPGEKSPGSEPFERVVDVCGGAVARQGGRRGGGRAQGSPLRGDERSQGVVFAAFFGGVSLLFSH